MSTAPTIRTVVSWPSAPLTHRLVCNALKHIGVDVTDASDVANDMDSASTSPRPRFVLQWATYDALDHELTHRARRGDNGEYTVLASSYTFRKALIRKHFLARCLRSYLVKHPLRPAVLTECGTDGEEDKARVLHDAVPETWDVDVSCADDLDELWCDELWDLGRALSLSEDKDAEEPRWWLLKPGMADRGMGLRMFRTKDGLRRIFERFDEAEDGEDEDEDDDGNDGERPRPHATAVITSQLRHFVVQEYISTPLLLDPAQIPLDGSSPSLSRAKLTGHKFHMRAYCVASGALTVYLYTKILALFAAVPYALPPDTADAEEEEIDLTPHLTNTSLQTHRGEEGVRLLDELVGCDVLSAPDDSGWTLSRDDVAGIVQQMSDILGETFKAALENPVHFQPVPNAFELYGVDFLVAHPSTRQTRQLQPPSPSSSREKLQVMLLEMNAEPAIELTGPRLTWILEDLFVAIGQVCVAPFFRRAQATTRTDLQQSKNEQVSAGDENWGGDEDASWGVGQTRLGLRKCLEVAARA